MIAARQVSPVTAIGRAGEDRLSRGAPAGVKVVLLGGDPLYREGMKSLLGRHGLAVLGEFDGKGETDLTDAAALRPDVVLAVCADGVFPAEDSWRQQFRDEWPGGKVLAMAYPGDDGILVDAIRTGADGCLFTDTTAEALIQSVRLVALGEGLFPARLGALLARGPAACAQPQLTPREKDILRGLLAGHSNKMIANDLGTTDMTVKAQLRHLLRKLGVANRTQAALWAREQGIVSDLQH